MKSDLTDVKVGDKLYIIDVDDYAEVIEVNKEIAPEMHIVCVYDRKKYECFSDGMPFDLSYEYTFPHFYKMKPDFLFFEPQKDSFGIDLKKGDFCVFWDRDFPDNAICCKLVNINDGAYYTNGVGTPYNYCLKFENEETYNDVVNGSIAL